MWIVESVMFSLLSGVNFVPVISPAIHRSGTAESELKTCPEILADFPGQITTCPQCCAEHEVTNNNVGH